MPDWREIARQISKATGSTFSPDTPRQISGGCINNAIRLSDGVASYFVKFNQTSMRAMFEAEMAGLLELAASHAIRVPQPICCGTTANEAYLVIEHIQFGTSGDSARAGRELAAMHRTRQEQFGWHRDNTIGSTPQSNARHADWVTFWRDERLGLQLELAANSGLGGPLIERGELLLSLFPALIDHNPQPSLLHGDLWGGNLGYDRTGNPVIFDPATYYGDREADLAMTELFGGFGQPFYRAYNEAWPLDAGYAVRKTLYNLYHIINHLNLFGGGYAGQALRMTEQLLAELGH